MCRPHYQLKKNHKRFDFELIPVPFKDVTFLFGKMTPFGKFEFKHDIHKRQIVESEISPVTNEIPARIPTEEISKTPEGEVLDKKEKDLSPEVIISSVINPVENEKSFPVVLPVESNVLMPPATNGNNIKQSTAEVLITEEIIPKPDDISPPEPSIRPIIEITPKPVDIPLPPISKPVKNVVISTPVESTVPPIISIPVFQNSKGPVIFPVIGKVPDTPLLHTDITQIPLGGMAYPAPVPIPVPDVIVPPPIQSPPPIKEPPVVKEETPNFFVKGSRFVLYFGSMMLQMLTQLVNGRINLNQPLPAVLPEIQ